MESISESTREEILGKLQYRNYELEELETPIEVCEKLYREVEIEKKKRKILMSEEMSVCLDDIGSQDRKQKIDEMKEEIEDLKTDQETLINENKNYEEGILNYEERIENEKVNYDEFDLDLLELKDTVEEKTHALKKTENKVSKEKQNIEYLEREIERLQNNLVSLEMKLSGDSKTLRWANSTNIKYNFSFGKINDSLWNDHFLATAGSEFKIWSTDQKDVHLITTLTGNKEEITSIDSRIDYLQYSFLASSGKSLHLWQMPIYDKKPEILPIHVTYEGHEEKVTKTSFIPCHQDLLASCSMDKTIRVWDRTKKNSIANVSLDLPCTNLACSHYSIITAQNEEVYIFDNKSLKLQRKYEHDSPISSVEVSPNGRYLLLNLPEKKSMACMDLRTFKVVQEYPSSCSGKEWRCPKFSPSGNYLAAGMEGASSVVIWNSEGKFQSEVWQKKKGFTSCSWSPKEDYILICNKNGVNIIERE